MTRFGWSSADGTHAHQYLLPAILRLLPSSGTGFRVLDVGCGNGYVASRLAERGFQVSAFDVSPDGIEIAKREYGSVRFEVSSIYDPLPASLGEDFDWVISSEVIEHLYYPKRLLDTAFAALKPGGGLIVTTPYHGYLKNLALSVFNMWDFHHTVNREGGHIKFFSEHTLKALLEERGFRNVRFANAGRVPWLWKSMVCSATKRHDSPEVPVSAHICGHL